MNEWKVRKTVWNCGTLGVNVAERLGNLDSRPKVADLNKETF